MKWYRLPFFHIILGSCLILFVQASIGHADALKIPDFSIHKLDSKRPGNTILIVGGIQGDEPGGFNAAALIITQYKILSGSVWVVPNLNFLSIIKRSRGVFGDLNRKFDRLHPTDPEFKTIRRIKELIVDPQVNLVLNLHDGSGYFRHKYMDKMRNPRRWGQCIIIDQPQMDKGTFPNLALTAQRVVSQVNQNLINQEEHFLVNNTQTDKGNSEMAKTLTWFAIKNNKAAFGIEASKSFLTPKRTYYHLLAIESFFRQAGILYKRRFKLSRHHIKKAIDADIQVAFNHQKILLPIEDIRKRLAFIPLQKNSGLKFTVSHPLMTIIPFGDVFSVIHGNRRMTHLAPQYFDYDFDLNDIKMTIDGHTRTVPFGGIVPVKNWFRIPALEHHRVNIIGYSQKNRSNEAGLIVKKEEILKRYSIDRKGSVFRVEVYKNKKFSGMILVDFGGKKRSEYKIALKNPAQKRHPGI